MELRIRELRPELIPKEAEVNDLERGERLILYGEGDFSDRWGGIVRKPGGSRLQIEPIFQ